MKKSGNIALAFGAGMGLAALITIVYAASTKAQASTALPTVGQAASSAALSVLI